MKRYILPAFVILLMIVLMNASCQTAPVVQDGEQTTVLRSDTYNVDEVRKKAQDFEAPSYFPSEWENVEAQYTNAKSQDSLTANEINAIEKTYEQLLNKAVSLYAQAREDEIMSARDELIDSGFASLVPEYLEDADNAALDALAQYEAGDYYKARDTALTALDKYETLLVGADVYMTRQEIIDRGFFAYDLDNFEKADEIAQKALDDFEAGNTDNAMVNADEALLRYSIILHNGWTAYAADRRISAAAERERALANKVNVAVRDGFREADILYNRAEEIFVLEEYERAANLYVDSETLFVISGQETENKRIKAMETMRAAEEKIEESDGTAIEAERIIEGGSR
jgi:tetratricopeptide (TPR) repeat protein